MSVWIRSIIICNKHTRKCRLTLSFALLPTAASWLVAEATASSLFDDVIIPPQLTFIGTNAWLGKDRGGSVVNERKIIVGGKKMLELLLTIDRRQNKGD